MAIIETVETAVCVDCLMIGVTGDVSGCETPIMDIALFTAGMDIIARINGGTGAHIAGTDGEPYFVAHTACGVCGSTLGGDRVDVTVFVLA